MALFEEESGNNAAAGTFNDDSLVRGVLSASIKRSRLSRAQISEKMTILLGLSVTERMLASFTAESKELHRWPGAWDRAFCVATGDDTLLRCRAEAAGYQLIRGEEIELLELGKEFLRQKHATDRLQLLEKRLAGVEL